MATVELNNLEFGWPGQAPLLSIDRFHLEAGERLFLQGPSGSGKSTLLNLLTGMLTPDRGEVRIAGTVISDLSGSGRDRFRADHIGFIFQSFNLLPYLSLIENVMLPCHFSRQRRDRARQRYGSVEKAATSLLAELGLVHDGSVLALSVGQQQRVAVARALIGSPPLLVADEPTSALDADRCQQFLQLLLNEVEQQSSSLLVVSHNLALGQSFDRSVSLERINQVADKEQSHAH